MICFKRALAAWGTIAFEQTLRDEIERLDPALLPLQQGLAAGSYALGGDIQAMVLSTSETRGCIQSRVGIFYRSIIAGCSCADDPTPVDECNEYCEVDLEIDKKSAETAIMLAST